MKIEPKRSIQIGLISSIVGISIGVYLAVHANGGGYEYFYLYSGSAAFLTSALLWWWLIERKKRFSVRYGALVGILSGTVSHFVCWYLIFVSVNIQHWLFKNWYSSLGEPPANLLDAVSGSLAFSFWSLMVFGRITVPAGVLICAVGCMLIKNRTGKTQ